MPASDGEAPRVKRGRAPAAVPRKEKSLGLLCERFCALHAELEPGTELELDSDAAALGVERRRMYDVLGVLESCEIVVRNARRNYAFYGRCRLVSCLLRLRTAKLSSQPFSEEDGEDDESRKDKSLLFLARHVLQLFLAGGEGCVISLDQVAQTLLGDGLDAAKKKTKIRRLYDIANVFTSLALLEKVRDVSVRKPTFRWLGVPEGEEGAAAPPQAEVEAPARKRRTAPAKAPLEPKQPRLQPRARRQAGAVAAQAAEDEEDEEACEAASEPQAAPFLLPLGEVQTTAWSHQNALVNGMLTRFVAVASTVAAASAARGGAAAAGQGTV